MSSYGVSYLFSFSGNWRAMFACAAVPTLALMIGLLFIPESPRWLAEKGHYDDAIRINDRSGSRSGSAEREIKAIRETVKHRDGVLGRIGLVPACAWPSSSVWHSAFFPGVSGGYSRQFLRTVDFSEG